MNVLYGMAMSESFVIKEAGFFMDTYFTMVIVGKTEIEVFYSISIHLEISWLLRPHCGF